MKVLILLNIISYYALQVRISLIYGGFCYGLHNVEAGDGVVGGFGHGTNNYPPNSSQEIKHVRLRVKLAQMLTVWFWK